MGCRNSKTVIPKKQEEPQRPKEEPLNPIEKEVPIVVTPVEEPELPQEIPQQRIPLELLLIVGT